MAVFHNKMLLSMVRRKRSASNALRWKWKWKAQNRTKQITGHCSKVRRDAGLEEATCLESRLYSLQSPGVQNHVAVQGFLSGGCTWLVS